MSEIETFFETLFFGSGSVLGLLLILAVCASLTASWKYGGAITFVPLILMGFEYLNNSLPYYAMTMFLASIFILLIMVKQLK